MQRVLYDRFIPCRSGMNMDVSRVLLRTSDSSLPSLSRGNERGEVSSSSYKTLLAETLFENRTRILAFSSKNAKPATTIGDPFLPSDSVEPTKRRFRKVPSTPMRILSAPSLKDDYCLNLLDWGSRNVVALALDDGVAYWVAQSDGCPVQGSFVQGIQYRAPLVPVTSVNWSPDGRRLAIGLNNSRVDIWDADSHRQTIIIQGRHRHDYRVGALSWQNDHCLTSGGKDGMIVNNDLRVRSAAFETYRGHRGEVCGLKWDESGRKLASGGNDDLLHIWDVSMASSSSSPNQNQWLHRIREHKAAVKALAWCPFQRNVLASGGGTTDGCIKLWNTQMGTCRKSIDTGSQVCALIWNKHEKELLSSHGFPHNQLTLWDYSSMDKMVELKGHTSRVLFMAMSPDGCTVASAAADESLRFWNVFAKSTGHAAFPSSGLFSSFNHIRSLTSVVEIIKLPHVISWLLVQLFAERKKVFNGTYVKNSVFDMNSTWKSTI